MYVYRKAWKDNALTCKHLGDEVAIDFNFILSNLKMISSLVYFRKNSCFF